ncbi:hypothetical protein TNCT_636711 [Trichonephila clavata]|uniref:Uncharacterized protein n=1 Tax=Trichonephila clavata TaxID=2740835 RepID=A0A8X6HA58_TRICU|nr:hypothetical protein TNCT_636711 [Trichonephila clavata]
MTTQQTAPWENWHLERGFKLLRTFGLVRWGLGGNGDVEINKSSKIDKSSTKRPATDNVQEAPKILKPSIRIESGGIQTTKEVEDVMLLGKKGKSRQSYLPIKYNSEKPKGSP